MPTSNEFLNFVLDQLSLCGEEISHRAMMGEYVIYFRGKIAGGLYDNRLLVKNVPSARTFMPDARLENPYEGAKPMLCVENLDSREYLRDLMLAMEGDLAAPRKRTKKA